jgi:uncharacterized OsmC-like protein
MINTIDGNRVCGKSGPGLGHELSGHESAEVGMDGSTLREVQAPLKQRYRDEPASAITPLQATATFEDAGITCTVQTWSEPVRAGLHAATGGDGSDACSGDMLLQALLACAGVTLRSVATVLGIDIRSATAHAQGRFDARGTLGVSRDTPVGVSDIQLTFELDTDADDQLLVRLAAMTERYCVVAQSLAELPTLRIRRVPTAG